MTGSLETVSFDAVPEPDNGAREQAIARQAMLTKPTGALGRLEDVSVWLAGVQGRCPPLAPKRIRVVIFAGDHGVAAAGVSAYPSEVTAQMAIPLLQGTATPSTMAVRGPRQTKLSVNLVSAAALGLTVPDSVLHLADEVVDK